MIRQQIKIKELKNEIIIIGVANILEADNAGELSILARCV